MVCISRDTNFFHNITLHGYRAKKKNATFASETHVRRAKIAFLTQITLIYVIAENTRGSCSEDGEKFPS